MTGCLPFPTGTHFGRGGVGLLFEAAVRETRVRSTLPALFPEWQVGDPMLIPAQALRLDSDGKRGQASTPAFKPHKTPL